MLNFKPINVFDMRKDTQNRFGFCPDRGWHNKCTTCFKSAVSVNEIWPIGTTLQFSTSFELLFQIHYKMVLNQINCWVILEPQKFVVKITNSYPLKRRIESLQCVGNNALKMSTHHKQQ